MKPETLRDIWFSLILIGLIVLIAVFTFDMIGLHINLDTNVIIDRDISPSHNGALYGIITVLPQDHNTYCISAETLSRGEPIDIGIFYRVPKSISPDRFGSEKYENSGAGRFVTDNTKTVNVTVTIPNNAVDRIVTASYSRYVSENRVHVLVKRC